MKKLVSLVLALVLAMRLCAVSLPASAEGTTEVIYWQMGNAGQKDIAMVMEKLNEQLHEVHPDITVNIQFVQGSEWKDRLTRAMAASERIDMAWMGWHHNKAQEAIDGNILPLGEGYLGVDGWEEQYNLYRDQMYANGLQDVIDEAQAQVNAYAAENGITA